MDSKNKKLNRRIIFTLFAIVFLGTILRLAYLSKSPPSLNWDEASLGYNAYSLLTTGSDEYGFKFPITFRSFDDYKPPLYPYITVPFIAIFGLNEFAARLPSAIAGISIIIAIYLITSFYFGKYVALLSAFFIAIEPWAVHFSRVAFETNLGLSFLLWSIFFAITSFNNYKRLIISIFLLFLSSYTYHSYRILLIPILASYILINKNIFQLKKHFFFLTAFILIFVTPLIFIMKSGGFARLESTSILRIVDFSKSESPMQSIYLSYTLFKNIIGRYFAYFSPANLFIRGSNEPNQQIPGFGIFYPIEFLFFIIGAYYLIKSKIRINYLLFALLLSPVPAIITWNWFTPSRTLITFCIFSIIIGFGAYNLLIHISRQKIILKTGLLIMFSVILLSGLGKLVTTYLFYIPYVEKGNWQFGFREIMKVVSPIQDNYDQIIFETGQAQPHIFTLFYGKYPPVRYHKDLGSPNAVEKPRKNFNFGKYNFRRIYWPDDRNSTNILFIGSEYSLPIQDVASAKNAKIISDVYDSQGDFVARIVETR